MAKFERCDTKNLTFRIGVTVDADGSRSWTHEAIHTALLMDIRDELQSLNALLHCHNFTGIPVTLRTIARKLPAKKRTRKAKA